MGVCPVCGGGERSPLATAFWRCDTIVTDPVMGMVPVSGGAPGMMAPMPGWRQRACGNEYYDVSEIGGQMEFCEIDDSNGAIGRCFIDRRLVCGYCSDMRGGRRLCNDCIGKADTAKAQAEAGASYDKLRDGMDRVRSVCASLVDVPDPADRFLVLLLLAHRLRHDVLGAGTPGYPLAAEETRRILASSADAVLGWRTSQVWDTRSEQPLSWTFNSAALASAWLGTGRLQYATASSLSVITFLSTSSGRSKLVKQGKVDAWKIADGAPCYDEFSGGSVTPDIYLIPAGTIAHGVAARRELLPELNGADREPLGPSRLHLIFEAQPATRPCLPETAAGIFESLVDFRSGHGLAWLPRTVNDAMVVRRSSAPQPSHGTRSASYGSHLAWIPADGQARLTADIASEIPKLGVTGRAA